MSESLAGLRRSMMCGEVGLTQVDTEVTLMGWVQRRRDHGGLIFIDLGDFYAVPNISEMETFSGSLLPDTQLNKRTAVTHTDVFDS